MSLLRVTSYYAYIGAYVHVFYEDNNNLIPVSDLNLNFILLRDKAGCEENFGNYYSKMVDLFRNLLADIIQMRQCNETAYVYVQSKANSPTGYSQNNTDSEV